MTDELVPIEQAGLVMPADTKDIRAAVEAFERAKREVIRPGDIQHITGKDFVKKSGWRRIARAFNLSMSIVKIDITRNDNGQVTAADVWARATAPNGVYAEAYGGADNHERDFNKGQDIVATAQTRATNRAISDLVAGGEVSAEEMGETASQQSRSQPPPQAPPSATASQDNWDGSQVINYGKNKGKRFVDVDDGWLAYCSKKFDAGPRKHEIDAEIARRQYDPGPVINLDEDVTFFDEQTGLTEQNTFPSGHKEGE